MPGPSAVYSAGTCRKARRTGVYSRRVLRLPLAAVVDRQGAAEGRRAEPARALVRQASPEAVRQLGVWRNGIILDIGGAHAV